MNIRDIIKDREYQFEELPNCIASHNVRMILIEAIDPVYAGKLRSLQPAGEDMQIYVHEPSESGKSQKHVTQ